MYLRRSSDSLYLHNPLLFVLVAGSFVISVQSFISVKSVVLIIGYIPSVSSVATRFDHHAVSVAAIRTKPFSGIHLFVIGIYAYCPEELSPPSIPEFSLVVFISDGTQSIPADIKSLEISSNGHPLLLSSGQRGNFP